MEEAVTSPGEALGRVERELRALWSAPPAPGETPRARACTMNLVVVAAAPALAAQWVPVVDEVLQSIPARAIVAGLDLDGPDGLDADAAAVCTPGAAGATPGAASGTPGAANTTLGAASGTVVCSERVSLTAHGAVCARLPSCVATLCATDVPTTLVWLGRVHANDPAFEPLARDASRIVLDAAQGSLGSLAGVVYWARARAASDRPGVADLAWTRLAPWQELCARMFDEPRLRPLADRITRVALVQAAAPGAPLGSEGALLLGWLATRLGWKAASLAGKLRLLREDGGHVHAALCAEAAPQAPAPPGTLLSVQLEAAAPDGSMQVRGEVAREPGDPDVATWRLAVTPAGGETQRIEQHVRLRAGDAARLLERTLHRPTHDPALADSAVWADELRGEELACA
jgi:glucose-6-phosphate dehydrogenase assembly protein OpcA